MENTATNTMAQILHYKRDKETGKMTIVENRSRKNQERIDKISAERALVQSKVDSLSNLVSFVESCYGDFQNMSSHGAAVALCQDLTVRKASLLGSGW
jgi:hypothetical protein